MGGLAASGSEFRARKREKQPKKKASRSFPASLASTLPFHLHPPTCPRSSLLLSFPQRPSLLLRLPLRLWPTLLLQPLQKSVRQQFKLCSRLPTAETGRKSWEQASASCMRVSTGWRG